MGRRVQTQGQDETRVGATPDPSRATPSATPLGDGLTTELAAIARAWELAARHATEHGLRSAAAYAGVHPATLHRQLLQLGERALRSN